MTADIEQAARQALGPLERSLVQSLRTVAGGPELRVSPSTNPGLTKPGPTRDAIVKVARQAGFGDAVGSAAEHRILQSLAWWLAAGIAAPSRHQVAFGARYTVNGHFNNTLGALRSRGMVTYPAGAAVALTDEGRAVVGKLPPPATREELLDRAAAVLRDEPQRRLFAALRAGGGLLSREALAMAAGYTVNGHFNNTLGGLRSLGLVEYPDRGQVALGAMFSEVPS